MVTLDSIRAAAGPVYRVAHITPVLHSHNLSARFGADIALKAECLQRTGSFKARGAAAKLTALTPSERAAGVIAASAGNHAQGVAVAAAALGVASTIVMPETAPLAKIEATRGYGAEVLLHGAGFGQAAEYARALAKKRGLTFIPAFDDEAIIAGQGTVGLELAEQCPDARLVLVPVGGGGLAAGMAIALKALRPDVSIIGVQAAAAPGAQRSFRAGHPVEVAAGPTVADGVAVPRPGDLTVPLLRRYLDDIVTVEEEAIVHAIVLLLERTKLVVEGAGALGVAALLSGAVEARGRSTTIVLSGGNIDINFLATAVQHGMLHAGRYLTLTVRLQDRPGALERLLEIIAAMEANVLDIAHHRVGVHVPVRGVEVRLLLETRNSGHIEELLAAVAAAGYAEVGTDTSARTFDPAAWGRA
ncbi:MAG: threonine ammonia-lyase [Dehalococcoidia bacterium]|nr:threonine ammonia-lyase [Dehalococcoidia bacterium]